MGELDKQELKLRTEEKDNLDLSQANIFQFIIIGYENQLCIQVIKTPTQKVGRNSGNIIIFCLMSD